MGGQPSGPLASLGEERVRGEEPTKAAVGAVRTSEASGVVGGG